MELWRKQRHATPLCSLQWALLQATRTLVSPFCSTFDQMLLFECVYSRRYSEQTMINLERFCSHWANESVTLAFHSVLCCMCVVVLHLQMPWEEVRKEMVEEKGLSEEAADQIGEYVSMQGETRCLFWVDGGAPSEPSVGEPSSLEMVRSNTKSLLSGAGLSRWQHDCTYCFISNRPENHYWSPTGGISQSQQHFQRGGEKHHLRNRIETEQKNIFFHFILYFILIDEMKKKKPNNLLWIQTFSSPEWKGAKRWLTIPASISIYI